MNTATYPFGGATAFDYDTRGQMSLENSNRGAGFNHAFDYDGAGNPTTWKGTSRTFNVDNQETTGGNFGYNGDGSPWQYLNRNLKNAANLSGTKQILSYTSLGQLRQINAQNSDGSARAAIAFYGYRGDGKRAWTQNPTSGNRTYYYAGDTLLGTSGDGR